MNNFREKILGPGFSKENVAKIKDLIERSVSFVVLGMPGVGVSIFLRYLATLDFAYFIYVDTYELSSINRVGIYKLLLRKIGGKTKTDSEQDLLDNIRLQIEKLCKSKRRVVIILNRFDQLKNEFDNQLLANIRSIRNVNTEKVVIIFTGNKPYSELIGNSIRGDNFNFISKNFYLKPYSASGIRKLISISAKTDNLSQAFVNKALKLSGGHFQLLQLFLKSERIDPPFIDKFVQLQLREIFESFNYRERKILEKLAWNKQVEFDSDYLLDIGIVQQVKDTFKLFTPLLSTYIKDNTKLKLPVLENKLFKLLKENIGRVVSKDEIFNYVWEENFDIATDWALNSLIYRLRKNQAFIAKGYVIESYKKQGYQLIKL